MIGDTKFICTWRATYTLLERGRGQKDNMIFMHYYSVALTAIMLTLIFTSVFALIQMVHAEYSCTVSNSSLEGNTLCTRELSCIGFSFNIHNHYELTEQVAKQLEENCGGGNQTCDCLSISNSSIPILHLEFNKNTAIKRLALEGNEIQGLDDNCFEGTENTLVYLSLANNRITNQHLKLRKLEKLEALDLSFNELDDLPQLQNTPSLSELKLDCNHIKQAEFKLGEVESLHSLSLASNNLKVINFVATASNLAMLYLQSNELTSLQLPSNVSLDVLDASQNFIQTWTTLDNSTTVDKMNLSCNQIQLIDEYMLASITEELDLTDNPLLCNQSICALQDYLLSRNVEKDFIPTCQSPAFYQGKYITEYNCQDPSQDKNSKLAVIAISVSISVLFIILMIVLAVMYLRKYGRILFVKREQRSVDDYAYDGPGLDTFELNQENSHM